MTKIRLQVALARAGAASRRKSAHLVESGRVTVNGKVVKEKAFPVDAAGDKITLDGKILSSEKKCYYILNKPTGVLSAASDRRGAKTVADYAKVKNARLYPAGRLDKDTTGLIVLTNDGRLTYRMTHPKFNIDRVYEVKAKGRVNKGSALRLKNGVNIDGRAARAEKIAFIKKTAHFTVLLLTIREGRKREVRRMFGAIGHDVLGLKRIAYGPLKVGNLKEGGIRPLTVKELGELKSSIGL